MPGRFCQSFGAALSGSPGYYLVKLHLCASLWLTIHRPRTALHCTLPCAVMAKAVSVHVLFDARGTGLEELSPAAFHIQSEFASISHVDPGREIFINLVRQLHKLVVAACVQCSFTGQITSQGRLLLWLLAHRALHFSRRRYVEGRCVNAGLSKSCSNFMHFAVQCCQS